ncbi:hypothetical protein M3Y99_00093900 [Aphelenchoides fujianensis]|nr:hypothetical protein M3Y99_00093900 [Aphelenchoides fujianensis]
MEYLDISMKESANRMQVAVSLNRFVFLPVAECGTRACRAFCVRTTRAHLHIGQGTLDERSAVHLAEIADLAASLELDNLIEPVISVQSEESRLLVRRYNGIVVAVHKTI